MPRPTVHPPRHRPSIRSSACAIGCVISSVLLGGGGCNRSSSVPRSPDQTAGVINDALTDGGGGRPNVAASTLLRRILDRYPNARWYRDRGRVVARPSDGAPVVAPMSVTRGDDRLSFVAYAASAEISPAGLSATIEDYDDQQLSIPRGTLADDALLLRDPVLAAAMAAGAGGPPPQLDWLLADEPMEHLFVPSAKFYYADAGRIEGRICQTVVVQISDDAKTNSPDDRFERTGRDSFYRFSIDVAGGVIRRVELPAVPTSDGDGQIELTIELVDASFEPFDPAVGYFNPPRQPVHVRRLIVPPPSIDPRLGRRMPVLLSRTDLPPVTWIVRGGESVETTDVIMYLKELANDIVERSDGSFPISNVPIAIQPPVAPGSSYGPSSWARSTSSNNEEVGDGELWVIDAYRRLQFVQPLTPPIVPDALVAATRIAAAGEDVAAASIDRYRRDHAEYLRRRRRAGRRVGLAAPDR